MIVYFINNTNAVFILVWFIYYFRLKSASLYPLLDELCYNGNTKIPLIVTVYIIVCMIAYILLIFKIAFHHLTILLHLYSFITNIGKVIILRSVIRLFTSYTPKRLLNEYLDY